METNNQYIAELMVRCFAGILFFFQGYDKLFKIKIPGVIDVFKADAQRNHIPSLLIKGVAYYTSLAELLGGILLIVGFCTNYAIYALALDLLLVAIAFSYMEPMWNLKHVFPRFVLLVCLLLLPAEYRQFDLDHLVNLK